MERVEAVLRWVEEHVGPGKDFPSPRAWSLSVGKSPDVLSKALTQRQRLPSADTLIAHARAVQENPTHVLKLAGYIDDTGCMDELSASEQELVRLFRGLGPAERPLLLRLASAIRDSGGT